MTENNCQIRNSNQKGNGVYALKPFKKGETVYICQIEEFNVENSVHASQVDMNKWVLFSLIGRTINHSCDPNCGVLFDGANWGFIALEIIFIDDELTYDYAMSNFIIDHFPICKCGSPICRREIKGFKSMPEQRKKQYKGFLAPYLQKQMEKQGSY